MAHALYFALRVAQVLIIDRALPLPLPLPLPQALVVTLT